MINFILWLLFGALVGWLASIVMRTDAQQGALLNIVVGIIGAMLGGFLFNLLGLGGSSINNNDFSLSALLSEADTDEAARRIAVAVRRLRAMGEG